MPTAEEGGALVTGGWERMWGEATSGRRRTGAGGGGGGGGGGGSGGDDDARAVLPIEGAEAAGARRGAERDHAATVPAVRAAVATEEQEAQARREWPGREEQHRLNCFLIRL